MKIRPVGAKLLRADGQTDTTKLTVTFHNFVNAPTKATSSHLDIEYFVDGLSNAGRASLSVAMQEECRPLYCKQSDHKRNI
jgi:hypothetical protein